MIYEFLFSDARMTSACSRRISVTAKMTAATALMRIPSCMHAGLLHLNASPNSGNVRT